MMLDSILQLDLNRNSVGCAGALLMYLKNTKGSLVFNSVSLFSLADLMQISPDTFFALHIFEARNHPNLQMNKSVEGTSLFLQLNKTRTRMGRYSKVVLILQVIS